MFLSKLYSFTPSNAFRSGHRSRSPRHRRSDDDRRFSFSRRDEPEPSRCLGVFGLSLYTTERDLKVCIFVN